MTLADQIIDSGPYMLDVGFTAEQANQLRDELLELRRLRTAAADLGECARRLDPAELHTTLRAEGCGWCGGNHLAELVRRADEHREDCRG